MFEDYYDSQAKRLHNKMKQVPWGTDERKNMLTEFLNYSRQSLTTEKLECAVRQLQTADGENLARKLFDTRYYGATLKTLSKELGIPIRKVRNQLSNLRKQGFVWYADQEEYKTFRYYLTDIKVTI